MQHSHTVNIQSTFGVEIVVLVGAHGGHDGEGVVAAGVLQLDRLLARLALAVLLDWCIDCIGERGTLVRNADFREDSCCDVMAI